MRILNEKETYAINGGVVQNDQGGGCTPNPVGQPKEVTVAS